MRFNHSIVVQEQAIAADGLFTYDLAVNPLSVVLINLRPLNDTGTLANFQSSIALAQALNRISISFRGQSIFSMRGEDAFALAYFRHGIVPYQGQLDNTNNEKRSLTIPILMGRHAYDPKSCFPASKRGELVMELDIDIADTGYDTMRLSVEAIELIGAHPTEFERKTTFGRTWPATGTNDMDLATGNVVRGLLLWGTTGYAGASPAPSWAKIKTLLDNMEMGYSATRWETAQMLHTLWGRQPPYYDQHKHIVTTDGNVQTELATLAGPYNPDDLWDNYAFLDFDPTADDSFSLDTRGAASFQIRTEAETADAVRCIQIEVMKPSDFTSG